MTSGFYKRPFSSERQQIKGLSQYYVRYRKDNNIIKIPVIMLACYSNVPEDVYQYYFPKIEEQQDVLYLDNYVAAKVYQNLDLSLIHEILYILICDKNEIEEYLKYFSKSFFPIHKKEYLGASFYHLRRMNHKK